MIATYSPQHRLWVYWEGRTFEKDGHKFEITGIRSGPRNECWDTVKNLTTGASKEMRRDVLGPIIFKINQADEAAKKLKESQPAEAAAPTAKQQSLNL